MSGSIDLKNGVKLSHPEGEGVLARIVWKRNVRGEQSEGDRMVVILPGIEEFKIFLKNSVQSKTVVSDEQKFEMFRKFNPFLAICLVQTSDNPGWRVVQIGHAGFLLSQLDGAVMRGWAKYVDDLWSDEAKEFLNTENMTFVLPSQLVVGSKLVS